MANSFFRSFVNMHPDDFVRLSTLFYECILRHRDSNTIYEVLTTGKKRFENISQVWTCLSTSFNAQSDRDEAHSLDDVLVAEDNGLVQKACPRPPVFGQGEFFSRQMSLQFRQRAGLRGSVKFSDSVLRIESNITNFFFRNTLGKIKY